jgi:predicted nucleic acid-binding protein
MTAASERFTLDTNLLVYTVDSAAGIRHRLARDIVLSAVRRDCWLTLQAISEFYSVATRKMIVPRPDAAGQAADWLELFPCAAASETAVRTALWAASAGGASYWDALLLATAAEAGCVTVLTEDLADGEQLVGVQIHNPFSPTGELTDRTRQLLGI